MLVSSLDPAPTQRSVAVPLAGTLSLAVMFVSGAAALAWQVLWTTQLSVGLGHEIAAVLAVLAAFFGGLSVGAQALGRFIARTRWPGRCYAACELLIAGWGVGLSLTLPHLMPAVARLIGPEPSTLWHWTIAFALPLLLLLPATAAMGVTLAAAERQLSASHGRLGWLYAFNTLGALAGLLLVVFVAIPQWGLQTTGWISAGTNALCALLAWHLWRAQPVAAAAAPTSAAAPTRPVAVLLITGFLGIGYEVLAVRVLSQVTENTVYSYALLLAVYLLGTAGGAAIYQRYWNSSAEAQHRSDRLLGALALSMMLSGASLWWADELCAYPARWLGVGFVSALSGEALAGLFALLLPAVFMGALFTHLCGRAQASGSTLGRALAFNTAGAALAPALVGVALLPALGARWCLVLLVLGYLLLTSRAGWRRVEGWLPALALGTLCVGSAPLRFVELPEGGRVISYQDGVMASVSVVADAQGIERLRINNRAQEGSSASGLVEWRLAQLPLLLHAAPRHALFLGLGTGFTAAAAAQESVQVDAVELLPEVIEAARHFSQSPHAPHTAPAVRSVAADARRFVQAGDRRYDVIVSDLFHPARSGAGALYTVEQFAAVRQRLAPDGLFCQWLALHQMDLDSLRSIVAAFMQVYPQALAVLASNSLDSPVLGLIARPDQPGFDLTALQTRLEQSDPATRRAARLEDVFALLGSVLAGPQALAEFAHHAPVNSDNHPVVVHLAPWTTYAPQTTPRQRLLTLVRQLEPRADQVLRAPHGALTDRLQAYWEARRRYIELGASTRFAADPAVMLRRTEQPLLALLRLSPDFRPAYDPLRSMAGAIEATDPVHAKALANELQIMRLPWLGAPTGLAQP